MKSKLIPEITFGLFLICMVGIANATVYSEDFEAGFPTWESGWLGTYTNIQNYYGVGQGRGNNPDGLWICDGKMDFEDQAEITFRSALGAGITDFSMDITTWIKNAKFIAWDMDHNLITEITITSLKGAWEDPGSYQTISLTGLDGMSGFSILGGWLNGNAALGEGSGWIEGNTAIDNIMINTEQVLRAGFNDATHAPEPATMFLFGTGLTGLGLFSRNRKRSRRRHVI